MDTEPVLIGTAAAASFMALALAGAFTVVSLAPSRPMMPVAVWNQPRWDTAAQAPTPPAELPTRALAAMPAVEFPPAREAAPAPAPLPLPGPAPTRSAQVGAPHPRPAVAAHPRPELRPRLAAVSLAPPPPRPRPATEGTFNGATLRRLRAALRLTRDQEPFWRPVEQALRQIGAQQAAMARAGQDPKEALGLVAAMRMYGVARPLLDTLREDQKVQVRNQARILGFATIASQI